MTKTAETLKITLNLQYPSPERWAYLGERLWTLNDVQSVMEVMTGELGKQTIAHLVVYLDNSEGANTLQEMLDSDPMLKEAACRIQAMESIEEDDWAEAWKQYWHVNHVTERLVIRPSWEPYTPKDDHEIVVQLDPGCAFGNGTHETTRLVLEMLEAHAALNDFSQLSILDVGTGTGILAIYAAKLGCLSVMALDNDPLAVIAAKKNVEANQLEHQINAVGTPLAEMCQTKYDVILSNIIAETIVELLPEMCLRLEKAGMLIASGIIADRVPMVLEAMEIAGFESITQKQEWDWFVIQGVFN